MEPPTVDPHSGVVWGLAVRNPWLPDWALTLLLLIPKRNFFAPVVSVPLSCQQFKFFLGDRNPLGGRTGRLFRAEPFKRTLTVNSSFDAAGGLALKITDVDHFVRRRFMLSGAGSIRNKQEDCEK